MLYCSLMAPTCNIVIFNQPNHINHDNHRTHPKHPIHYDHDHCHYKDLPDSPSASRCVGFLWHHRLTATRMLVPMMTEKIRMVMAIFMMVIKVLKNDVGKGLKYLHIMTKCIKMMMVVEGTEQ